VESQPAPGTARETEEDLVSDLIDFVIGKHGGLQRWEQAESVTAGVHVYGGFWGYKGQPDLLSHQSVTADLHRQRISMTPFGAGSTLELDQDADRVTITDSDGQVIDELIAPRASMAGFAPDPVGAHPDRLLHLLRHLDLPARAVPVHPAGRRDSRDRAVERGRRDLPALGGHLP
jgi:hypothetical protein